MWISLNVSWNAICCIHLQIYANVIYNKICEWRENKHNEAHMSLVVCILRRLPTLCLIRFVLYPYWLYGSLNLNDKSFEHNWLPKEETNIQLKAVLIIILITLIIVMSHYGTLSRWRKYTLREDINLNSWFSGKYSDDSNTE